MSERKANGRGGTIGSSHGLHASVEAITHWLVHRAALRAPPDLAERLEEEWQADLAVRSTVSSRMRFALGCCWATRIIAREYRPESVRAASTAMGPKFVAGFVRDESGSFARRSLAFFLVAGLHIALFYALMTGLTFKIIQVIPASFHTRILQSPPARTLPPLPPPQLTRPVLPIQPPEFPRTEGPLEDRDFVAEVSRTVPARPETPTNTPSNDVVTVQGGPGAGFPATDDYYPSIAKRMEEQGVATVHVCVGADGRLTAVPTIARSSGSPRLDGGALLLAKAGSGHYRASTEDGRAVSSCYAFRVRFALR